MPCWFFNKSELENTPSFCNGVDAAAEENYRREGAKLITDAGSALGLRYDVCATAAVYFHRFYMFHSFTDFHRYVVASSCLFLSAKMNESSVTCDAVVNAVQTILTPTQFSVFGEHPKQEILVTEKVLVEGLRFDLLVELPYPHLLKFIKLLQGESETIEQLLKMSWTFINDSFCTTLSVEWEPDLIAISLLYLSCRLMKFRVNSWVDKPVAYTGKWYNFFVSDVNLDIIENVCRQILDLYAGRGPSVTTQQPQSPSSKASFVAKQQSRSQLRKASFMAKQQSQSKSSKASSVAKQQPQSVPRKASFSQSARRRSSSSMSVSPPSHRTADRRKSERRQSRNRSRQHSRSRSSSRHRDDDVCSSQLGTSRMLTQEEFERLQRTARMNSGLSSSDLPTFTPPPTHFPHSIPVQHTPQLIYPSSVASSGQNVALQHHVILAPQSMVMPPPVHEQPIPFLGPSVEPPRLLVAPAPSHEVYHNPQFLVPPHVPAAQPMPSPAVFHHASHPGSTVVHTGDPHVPAPQHLPTPAVFQQRFPPGPPHILPPENQQAAPMPHPISVQLQQPQ